MQAQLLMTDVGQPLELLLAVWGNSKTATDSCRASSLPKAAKAGLRHPEKRCCLQALN